jgi:predicted nucleotidyltransferase component of viral defense system
LPRYSVDLDFYLIEGKSFEAAFKGLKKELAEDGYDVTDFQEKYFTYLIEVRKTGYPRRLKLEIRKRPLGKISTTQNIAYSKYSPNLQLRLVTLTLEQMFKNKIEAFLSRGEIRDAFDLEFLFRRGAGSFNDMPKETLEEVAKRLDSFKNVDFSNKLGNLLGPEDRKFYEKNRFAFLRSAIMAEINKSPPIK